MKKKPVDYSGFSIKKINEPRFSHIWLLTGWIFYFSMFFLTENLIPYEKCHEIHCALDDLIPFNEGFVIFYVGWFAFVVLSLAYGFFFNIECFKKIQTYIIITQIIAMACYILYPSIQHLRPESFERQNIFTWILGFIYSVDTPTGVCPSLHVGYSLGILSWFLKDKDTSFGWKFFITFFVIMVCAAVCFVKQHSVLDVLWAIPMCIVAELIVYGKDYWIPKIEHIKTR